MDARLVPHHSGQSPFAASWKSDLLVSVAVFLVVLPVCTWKAPRHFLDCQSWLRHVMRFRRPP